MEGRGVSGRWEKERSGEAFCNGRGPDILQVYVDTREWLAGTPTEACAVCLSFAFFFSRICRRSCSDLPWWRS